MTELEEAKEMLSACKAAQLAALRGAKTYIIGSRQLTRYDLANIRNEIIFWRGEVARLSGTFRRVMQIAPGGN